ncbi:MAG: helix-turn-helix domain-containing protein [Pseudonocardia sp.]
MDAEEAHTIGRRVRQIRYAREKSLRVIGELAGISASTLSRIETGKRALDSRAETLALADALGIAPSELTRQSEPTPGNGEGVAVQAVRRALIAVGRGEPAGQVVPVDVLRTRVAALIKALRQCQHERVGYDLPTLVRDLHTSIAAGRDVAELLILTTLLHGKGASFLYHMGASTDLGWQAALQARQVAREHGGSEVVGLATFASANALLRAGELDLAQTELDSVTVPTTTSAAEQLEGMLALLRSQIAAEARRPGDAAAPLDYAVELAARTGDGDAYAMGFGPTEVGLWQMSVALEARDFPRAAGIAEGLQPELLPFAGRKAIYWAYTGQALAHLRGRQDDAYRALRTAELISPTWVPRYPFVREVLAELRARSPRGAIGRELRAMAYRAGLSG